jgi:flagellar hook protein FlgE
MEADSTALNTIANNLSNMNTTAFKGQTAEFANLFYQQVGTAGSGDPISVGAGSQIAATQTDFSQGSISSTSQPTDLALQGNGFFVVDNGGSDVYTRAGNFTLSSSGNLTTQSGLNVMGYPAVNGVVNTSAGLTAINIPVGTIEPAKATSNFSMTANLDSTANVGTSFSTQVPVYDSLGTPLLATVTYTKTATNTWNYDVTMPETLNAQSATAAGTTTVNYAFGASGAGTLATVNTGTNLTISGNTAAVPPVTATITAPTVTAGETVATYATALQAAVTAAGITGVNVTAVGGTLTITGPSTMSTSGSVIQDPVPTATSGTLTFDTSGNLKAPGTNLTGITFDGLASGAAPLTVTWDLYNSSGTGNISQEAQTSGVSTTYADGYQSGQYSGFAVQPDGSVLASFTNGQKLTVGQLALASVTNEQGLQVLGAGDYAVTRSSGAATIGIAGTGGLATVQGGALEGSNVNISAEFSDLIIAQRAFEASSKAITTFDTVTEQSIQMLH